MASRTVVINVISKTGGAKAGIGGLNRQMKSLDGGAGKANKSVGKLGKSTGGLGRQATSAKRGLGSLAGGMGSAGLAAGAAGAAVLAVGMGIKATVGAFASFDDKMNQSLAIMGEVSDSMRDKMSNAAREMAKTTRFSAEDAAESYFFLASAGLNAEQSISALPQVAKFAQAGMFDMATATDLATDAQSALGLTSDDAATNLTGLTRVTDVFVKANTLANTSVQQVSEAITNKLGGALRAYNIDLEEGVAVLAAYADQGLKGAAAGEAMNIMLRDLKRVGTDSADVLAANNIQIFDATGNFRDQADIIDDLTAAFGGLSVAEQTQLAADIGFQDRSFKNIQLLLGMGDAVRGYREELEEAGGITGEVADNQLKSFSAQMDMMKSRMTDVGITIGEQLAPSLLEMAGGMLDTVEALTPLLKGLGQFMGFMFKISGINLFGKAVGFLRTQFDDTYASEQRLVGITEEVTQAVEKGADPVSNLNWGLQQLVKTNDLTGEAMGSLIGITGVTGDEFREAAIASLEYANTLDDSGESAAVLEKALLTNIVASDMDAVSKRELAFELGLVAQGASDLELMELGLIDSTVSLTNADGELVDENGNLVNAMGELIDAEGNLIDETGETTGEILTLAEALAEAEAAQTSLADAMLAFADPTFAAAKAIRDLQAAEAELVKVEADHESSAQDVADAELAVFEATLKAQGAMDAFSATGIEGQVALIRDVMGKSDEEARAFLEALGLIDGSQVTAGATVVFTASGSTVAQKAAAGGAASTNMRRFGPLKHGGPANKGQPYLVGEEGPELFVPNGSGTVIPANQTSNIINNGGNSRNINVTFVNSQLANDPVAGMRRAFARDQLQGKV